MDNSRELLESQSQPQKNKTEATKPPTYHREACHHIGRQEVENSRILQAAQLGSRTAQVQRKRRGGQGRSLSGRAEGMEVGQEEGRRHHHHHPCGRHSSRGRLRNKVLLKKKEKSTEVYHKDPSWAGQGSQGTDLPDHTVVPRKGQLGAWEACRPWAQPCPWVDQRREAGVLRSLRLACPWCAEQRVGLVGVALPDLPAMDRLW